MLEQKLKALAGKKEELSPLKMKAKSAVLQDLSDQAGEALGDKLRGIKKVSVAAPSPEGLEAGLETAKGLVEGVESPEQELPEHSEPQTVDEIDAKIAELEAKKQALLGTEDAEEDEESEDME